MAEVSKIEWCDGTWNPWEGCQKVGPGCDHCYAEARNQRFSGGGNWGPKAPRRRTSEYNWNNPMRWHRQHEKFFAANGRRRRIFCSSLADIFDNAVPNVWTYDALSLIALATNIDWILLTKRLSNVRSRIPDEWLENWPQHVGLMITVVNQEEADRDIPKLLDLKHFYRIPWVGLSMEPLIGPVSIQRYLHDSDCGLFNPDWGECGCEHDEVSVDWVIVGGESGPNARPMHPSWAVSLRNECSHAGTPFLFKQWGQHLHESLFNPFSDPSPKIVEVSGERYVKTTKERAGRYLHPWGYVNEFPKALEGAS